MNKRRLLKLADLLEMDAKNKKGMKFDIRVVGFVNGAKKGDAIELNCGTSACAMGLASISGAFNRQGLTYKVTEDWLNNIVPVLDGRVFQYDTAAVRLFSISRKEANFLFTPASYPENKKEGAVGERYVAKRIRDFVAGKVSPS